MGTPILDRKYSTPLGTVLGIDDAEYKETTGSLISVVNEYLALSSEPTDIRISEENFTTENGSLIQLTWSMLECPSLGEGNYLGASFQSGNRLFEFIYDPILKNVCIVFKQLNVNEKTIGLIGTKVLITKDPTYDRRRTTIELRYNDGKANEDKIVPFRLLLSRVDNTTPYYYKSERLDNGLKTINLIELNELLQETVRNDRSGTNETLGHGSVMATRMAGLVTGFSTDSRLVASRMLRRLIRGEVI